MLRSEDTYDLVSDVVHTVTDNDTTVTYQFDFRVSDSNSVTKARTTSFEYGLKFVNVGIAGETTFKRVISYANRCDTVDFFKAITSNPVTTVKLTPGDTS